MPSPRALFLLFLLALMESLAGFSVVVGSSLLDATSAGYGLFPLLLFAQLAGLTVALAVAGFAPREPWNRIASLGGGVLLAGGPALAVSLNPVSFLISTILLGVMYWRGIVTAEEAPSYDHVKGRFGLGYGLLFLGLLWIVARGIMDQADTIHMLAVLGIAYTIVAMIALTTARIEPTREPGAGGAIVLAVGLQLGILLLLGLVSLQIFSMDLAGAFLQWARPVTDVIGRVWYDVLLAIAGPVQHVIDLLRPHAHGGRGITLAPPSTGQQGPRKRFKSTPHNYPLVGFVAFLLVCCIIAAIGYAIWRALPRIPRSLPERGFTERREGTLTLRMLWSALRAWLRSLWGQSARLAEDAVGRTRRRIFPTYPADPIRRMYTQLLRRAADAGLPRASAMTPSEYDRQLVRRFSDVSYNLSSLTDAYVLRRYGEVLPGESAVSDASYHWQQIRHAILIPLSRPRRAVREGTAPPQPAEESPLPWQRAFWTRKAELPGVRPFPLWRGALIAAACLFTPILLFLAFLLMAALLGAQP